MAKKLAFDRVLFTTVMLLVGLGLVMVYSASAALARGARRGDQSVPGQAGGRRGARLPGDGVVMHVDYRKLRDRRVVYALVAGVLVAAGRCALLAAAERHPALVLHRRHLGAAVGAREAGAGSVPRLLHRPPEGSR